MCDHCSRRQAAENTELTHKARAEVGAGEGRTAGWEDCQNRTGCMLKRCPPPHPPTPASSRASSYHFAPGTTAVLTQEVRPLNLELLEETVQAMEVE